MTLVSSGTINLKGSSGDPTRSIEYECEGAVSGTFALTTAQSIASAYVGSLPTGLTDFYGYSACSDPTPGTPTSCVGSDQGFFAQCDYGTSTSADSFEVSYAISPWVSWAGPYPDAATPYTTTLGNGSWKFRVRGVNCSGEGAWRTSAAFTMS